MSNCYYFISIVVAEPHCCGDFIIIIIHISFLLELALNCRHVLNLDVRFLDAFLYF